MMTPMLVATGAGFILLSAFFYWRLYLLLRKALSLSGWTLEKTKQIEMRFLVGLVVWTAFLSVFSLSGVSTNFDLFPLNAGPILLIPLITIIIVLFSKSVDHLLKFVSGASLVRLQVFRLFVEILLWFLFIQNLLPVQMTFEGRNFDILSGLTAPIVAYFLINNRIAMVAWHLLCLGLLVNIVAVALLSMPTPFRVFENDPANTIVTSFPFVFLPGFLVPLAYGLHFLSLRQMAIKK